MNWLITIGLETHVQLATSSKIFSGAPTNFGANPNTQASFVDLALPGVLPVLNKQVVEYAIRFGLAVNGKIAERSVFARKNYFYPDLPKGYQISQFEEPIIEGGSLKILLNNTQKTIRLTRAHLEEDAGKSLHDMHPKSSAIDLNRAGTPLLEIVTEPDINSSDEAVEYAKTLYDLVTWIGICSGNLQEGNFRCDANVSVRKSPDSPLGTRREIKNLNSFKFLKSAIDFEISWQIAELEEGNKISQATVLYDADRNETRIMRSKEDAHDYRYFADPDLLPLNINDEMVQRIKKDMPELPKEVRHRFEEKYQLSAEDSKLLIANRHIASYFELTVEEAKKLVAFEGLEKLISNWILGELYAALNREELKIQKSPVGPSRLAKLISRICDGTLSSNLGKKVFEEIWATDNDVDEVISARGLKLITDESEIEKIVINVISENPHMASEYKSGKDKALNALVGKIMKATKGKANPQQVKDILKIKLKD